MLYIFTLGWGKKTIYERKKAKTKKNKQEKQIDLQTDKQLSAIAWLPVLLIYESSSLSFYILVLLEL